MPWRWRLRRRLLKAWDYAVICSRNGHASSGLTKYGFTPHSVGSPGVQLHPDLGFLTILQEDDDVGGHEVMDKSGSFMAIDPQPGTFLVNLGDMAEMDQVWSNGKWCNVWHRVHCKSTAIHVSIATFLISPKSELIEAPSVFVDSENP